MKKAWVSAVAVAAVAVLVFVVVVQVAGWNPFRTDTIDRSQPAVLEAVRDLSEYRAAAGDYQVVIDIEKDVAYIPAALAGQRTLFVAAGTIDAVVDFGGLVEESLVIDQEKRTVRLTLPEPRLGKPNLDNERSYVFSQERGLLETLGVLVGAPEDQRPFYVAAEQKITEAAGRSGLVERARGNTEAMLTGLLSALGYTVTIAPPAAP